MWIVKVPLWKGTLDNRVLFLFNAVLNPLSFSSFLVLRSSEFRTVGALNEKLFLPTSVFFRFSSRRGPLYFDLVNVRNGSSLLLRPCLTLNTSMAILRLYRYPRSCYLVWSRTLQSKISSGILPLGLQGCRFNGLQETKGFVQGICRLVEGPIRFAPSWYLSVEGKNHITWSLVICPQESSQGQIPATRYLPNFKTVLAPVRYLRITVQWWNKSYM